MISSYYVEIEDWSPEAATMKFAEARFKQKYSFFTIASDWFCLSIRSRGFENWQNFQINLLAWFVQYLDINNPKRLY